MQIKFPSALFAVACALWVCALSFGCAATRQLPVGFLQSEHARWNAYLIDREHGDHFRSSVYDSSETAYQFAVLDFDSTKLGVVKPIWKDVRMLRPMDSGGYHSAQFFVLYRDNLRRKFKTAELVDSLERNRP